MTFSFDNTRFNVKEFFSYPCIVCDRIVEYKVGNGTSDRYTYGNKNVKKFFDDCLEEAQKLSGKSHLMDNKIAIKVFDTVTNNTFYVGYKDNIYCIELTMNPYMNSTYTIKFD